MIGWTLAAVIAIGLVGIGIGALLAPEAGAAEYGIVSDDPRAGAFLRAMGVRDLSLGLVIGALFFADARMLAAWAIAASAPIALVDYLVVTADRRRLGGPGTSRIDRPRLLHAVGALGLPATAVLLWLGI